MKRILAPSILSADFGILASDIDEVKKGGAKWLHIDVMDGMFVPNISLGIPVIESIRKHSDLFFDVHLMIEKPERYISRFADAGADMITFHYEATDDPEGVISLIRDSGKKVGISIKPGTELDTILPLLDKVDMVLIMTVEPGFGGQGYISAMTDKIRALRGICDDKGLMLDIEVDGGIKQNNVHVVLDAGANVIVAGSAVFGGDVCAKTAAFMEELAK